MTEAPTLARGRLVSMLPRAGGHSWAGTVRAWNADGGHVVARIHADADAVDSLDHHQVWMSTVSNDSDGHGITIFAGRAFAVARESLELEGVVRLTDERRRSAVRATGSMVTLPPAGGPQCTVATIDISRDAVRLPVGEGGWPYDDPLDLVVHLGDARSLNVVGLLLRVDMDTRSVVLTFDDLPDRYAEAIDRFALTQLTEPRGGGSGPTNLDP